MASNFLTKFLMSRVYHKIIIKSVSNDISLWDYDYKNVCICEYIWTKMFTVYWARVGLLNSNSCLNQSLFSSAESFQRLVMKHGTTSDSNGVYRSTEVGIEGILNSCISHIHRKLQYLSNKVQIDLEILQNAIIF